MSVPDLKPRIWIPALIRRAEVSGAYGMIVRKGDPDGGSALIMVRDQTGLSTLYRPVRNMDGARVWWPKGPCSESDLNRYIKSRVEDDPDIWVVEIEDKQGRHFLVEPIEADSAQKG